MGVLGTKPTYVLFGPTERFPPYAAARVTANVWTQALPIVRQNHCRIGRRAPISLRPRRCANPQELIPPFGLARLLVIRRQTTGAGLTLDYSLQIIVVVLRPGASF